MKNYEEELNEIKKESELFAEQMNIRLDNLVNNQKDYVKACNLSYVGDRLNLFIRTLNEN